MILEKPTKAGEDIPISFKFVNSGNQSLKIENIITSCGCTAVKWNKNKIEPNKIGQIDVILNPYFFGEFNSRIKVYYNGKDSPRILKVSGLVEYLSFFND